MPELKLPKQENYPLGRFGRAKYEYLKCHHRTRYNMLVADCSLNKYLHEIDMECEKMYKQLIKEYAERDGIIEQLKAENQMEWVRAMNAIRASVEEYIYSVLIYENEVISGVRT